MANLVLKYGINLTEREALKILIKIMISHAFRVNLYSVLLECPIAQEWISPLSANLTK